MQINSPGLDTIWFKKVDKMCILNCMDNKLYKRYSNNMQLFSLKNPELMHRVSEYTQYHAIWILLREAIETVFQSDTSSIRRPEASNLAKNKSAASLLILPCSRIACTSLVEMDFEKPLAPPQMQIWESELKVKNTRN